MLEGHKKLNERIQVTEKLVCFLQPLSLLASSISQLQNKSHVLEQ